MKRVLFLCTHNSARSQMAEGLLRSMAGDRFEAHSAGTEMSRVHPLAIASMREVGVDISGQHSKSLDDFVAQSFETVITVCDHAAETCPVFPNAKRRIHWSFEDPSGARGTEQERLDKFHEIRDKITAHLQTFIDEEDRRGRLSSED